MDEGSSKRVFGQWGWKVSDYGYLARAGAPGVGVKVTTLALFDSSGEAARINFVYSDWRTGKGVATATGRRSQDVNRLLAATDYPVWTFRHGLLFGRSDLIDYVMALIAQVIRLGDMGPSAFTRVERFGQEPTPIILPVMAMR